MHRNSPFDIVRSRHITEKATVLQQLQFNASNPCVKKCSAPKYVFVVDKRANKQEIAKAIEEIYSDRKVTVMSVNTINAKSKARRLRGRPGIKPGFKKAIVTLKAGDSIEEKA